MRKILMITVAILSIGNAGELLNCEDESRTNKERCYMGAAFMLTKTGGDLANKCIANYKMTRETCTGALAYIIVSRSMLQGVDMDHEKIDYCRENKKGLDRIRCIIQALDEIAGEIPRVK